jgi:hypothetical protein
MLPHARLSRWPGDWHVLFVNRDPEQQRVTKMIQGREKEQATARVMSPKRVVAAALELAQVFHTDRDPGF